MTEIRKFTKEERASFGYTVAELRQMAREHEVRVPSRALHHELVAALKAAGVDLPMKPAQRINLASAADYTVAELRQLVRDRDVSVPTGATHDQMVAALTAAGVKLPVKPAERISRKPLNRRWR